MKVYGCSYLSFDFIRDAQYNGLAIPKFSHSHAGYGSSVNVQLNMDHTHPARAYPLLIEARV
jgi:hypothetical protein